MSLEKDIKRKHSKKSSKAITGLCLFVLVVGGIGAVKKIKEYKFKKSLAPNAIYEEMFKEFKDIDGDGYIESIIRYTDKKGKSHEFEIVWNKDNFPEIIYPTEK